MGAQEIKDLRKSGRLEEALALAQKELSVDLTNIWAKRNIGWVYCELLKSTISVQHFDEFIDYLKNVIELDLPMDEIVLNDQIGWQLLKVIFAVGRESQIDLKKADELLKLSKQLAFSRPSGLYSGILNAFHKVYKDSQVRYQELIDWWGLDNLRNEDYEKEKMPDGKEIISLAERVFTTYAKHLLPRSGEAILDRKRVDEFMPVLDNLMESHPEFQYPPYYKAKLLLQLGDKEDVLSALLPFARKKRKDFWVWDVLSEAVAHSKESVLACYCMALSCPCPEEFLIGVRERMAKALIENGFFNEARFEIERLTRTREANGYRVPPSVLSWQKSSWYNQAVHLTSNKAFYKKRLSLAETILYSDIPSENVIVDFVNTQKRVLNFIASADKFGFFSYDRFLNDVKIGDVLEVRFFGKPEDGRAFRVHSVCLTENESFKREFVKVIHDKIKLKDGRNFGFIGDAFIHPSIVSSYALTDGRVLECKAIKSFNAEKKAWGWKVFEVSQ